MVLIEKKREGIYHLNNGIRHFWIYFYLLYNLNLGKTYIIKYVMFYRNVEIIRFALNVWVFSFEKEIIILSDKNSFLDKNIL